MDDSGMDWRYAGDHFCVTEYLILQPAWKVSIFNPHVGCTWVTNGT